MLSIEKMKTHHRQKILSMIKMKSYLNHLKLFQENTTKFMQIDFYSAIDLDTMCSETDEVESLETSNMVGMQNKKTKVDLE